jgi:glutamate racemase
VTATGATIQARQPARPAEVDAAAPLLVFDSGVGGLSVLRKIRALLPDAPVIYAADNAGLPYGTKTEAQIAARVSGLLGRMTERFRPRLVCIACNTASTIALASVREVLEVPIVGTVPAIKPAAAMTRTGVIGLLGTEATIRQVYVDRLEAEFAAGKTLLRHGAPELVQAAEAQLRGEPVDPAVYARAAAALRAMPGGDRIDTVVLACTHFPLVQPELARAFGGDVRFIDGSDGIARRIAALTEGQAWNREQDDVALFTRGGRMWNACGPRWRPMASASRYFRRALQGGTVLAHGMEDRCCPVARRGGRGLLAADRQPHRAHRRTPDRHRRAAPRSGCDARAAPDAIDLEIVAQGTSPATLLVAGGGFGKAGIAAAAFRVRGPGGTVLIDSGLTREQAGKLDMTDYDAAAQQRVEAAMDTADRIVFTHEHYDRHGSFARHGQQRGEAVRAACAVFR